MEIPWWLTALGGTFAAVFAVAVFIMRGASGEFVALAFTGLAASNAPNAKSKELAEKQAKTMIGESTDDDLSRAKEVAKALQIQIDQNVRLYVNQ